MVDFLPFSAVSCRSLTITPLQQLTPSQNSRLPLQYDPPGLAIFEDSIPHPGHCLTPDTYHETFDFSSDWCFDISPLIPDQEHQFQFDDQQTLVLQGQTSQQRQPQSSHSHTDTLQGGDGRNSHCHQHQLFMQPQEQQQRTFGMEMSSSQVAPEYSQAQCASSASCPWVLASVPSSDGWSLQRCADLGCIPDVPDVEQCMPSRTPSQSSHDACPSPIPIDFTSPAPNSSTFVRSRVPGSPAQRPAESPDQVLGPPPSRKRQTSTSLIGSISHDSGSNRTSTVSRSKVRPTKVAHSVVEQRYRDNLNGKIAQLHKTLSTTKDSGSSSSEEEDSVLPRTRKADVLTSAIAYIKTAEKGRNNLENEVEFLKTRIANLEKLVKCEDCSILTQMNAMRLQAGFVV